MITVTILKQIHNTPELFQAIKSVMHEKELPPDMQLLFNDVAQSQFKIATYLSKNKGAVVVQESGTDLSQGMHKEIEKEVRSIFPKGLPRSYQELNFLQKKVLIKKTGVYFSVLSHTIDKVYGDNPAYTNELDVFIKTSQKFRANSPEWFKGISTLDQKREFATLAWVEILAAKAKKNEAILTYGAAHNFSDIIHCFPNLKLVTPKSVLDKKKSPVSKEYREKYDFFRPTTNCNQLALDLSLRGGSKLDVAPSKNLEESKTTSRLNFLPMETLPADMLLRMGLWAGSKLGLCENPSLTLPIALTDNRFRNNQAKEMAAELHFSKQGSSLESALCKTLQNSYLKATYAEKQRWRNLFIDVVNGDVSSELGNKFNKSVKSKRLDLRIQGLKELLQEHEMNAEIPSLMSR